MPTTAKDGAKRSTTKRHEPLKESNLAEIELRDDGWDRFEQAVDAAARSGPKHREPKRV